MDFRSSPLFTGKTRLLKPRVTRNPVQEFKTNANELQVSRQRRAFGTVKNPNIPTKTMPNKPTKPSISDSKTEPKSSTTTTTTKNIVSNSSVKTNNGNSIEMSKTAKLKKKGTCPRKQITENNSPSNSKPQNLNEPKTPMASRSVHKPRVTSTPYHSAENCSKCRFDRLETSSYWLAQIKLAESVSKHFVSACFFRLACESKAEPMKNLQNELKRYLVRHEHLRKETEWKEVSVTYGLFKEENSNAKTCQNVAVKKSGAGISSSINDLEQDQSLKDHDEAERN